MMASKTSICTQDSFTHENNKINKFNFLLKTSLPSSVGNSETKRRTKLAQEKKTLRKNTISACGKKAPIKHDMINFLHQRRRIIHKPNSSWQRDTLKQQSPQNSTHLPSDAITYRWLASKTGQTFFCHGKNVTGQTRDHGTFSLSLNKQWKPRYFTHVQIHQLTIEAVFFLVSFDLIWSKALFRFGAEIIQHLIHRFGVSVIHDYCWHQLHIHPSIWKNETKMNTCITIAFALFRYWLKLHKFRSAALPV